MKSRSTLILLIVLILLATYYLLFEVESGDESGSWMIASNEILTYGQDDVVEILYVNSRRDSFRFERMEEEWWITNPIRTPASGSSIDFLLKQSVPGQELGEITGVTDMSKFGLNNPSGVLVFRNRHSNDGDTIYVGGTVPTNNNYYIRVNSSDTVYISREIREGVMDKSFYYFRNKEFLHISLSGIDSVVAFRHDQKLSIHRQESEWSIRGSSEKSTRKAIRALNRILDAHIYSFSGEDINNLHTYGLEQPRRSIIIYGREEIIQASFGHMDNDLVFATTSVLNKVVKVKSECLELFRYISDIN